MCVAPCGARSGLLSACSTRDPAWHGLATYCAQSGVALIAALPLGVLLGIPPGTTPRQFSGLASWMLAVVRFAVTIVLALRLRHIARSAQ